MNQNYYEILEVDKKASPEIIKKAYNTLAKKYHPDLQKGDLIASYGEKLKLINEAYETLSDKEKRRKYDERLASSDSSLQAKVEALSRENAFLKKKLEQVSSSSSFVNDLRSINLQNNAQQNYDSRNYATRNNNYYNNSYKNNMQQDYDDSGVKYAITQFFKKLISFIIALVFFALMLRLVFSFPYLQ